MFTFAPVIIYYYCCTYKSLPVYFCTYNCLLMYFLPFIFII